jgi:hypothetical protein
VCVAQLIDHVNENARRHVKGETEVTLGGELESESLRVWLVD